jgi:hypothetical protein
VIGALPVCSGDIHEIVISPCPTDLTNKLTGSVGGSKNKQKKNQF